MKNTETLYYVIMKRGGFFKLPKPMAITTIDGDNIIVCAIANIEEENYNTPNGYKSRVEPYAIDKNFEVWCIDDLFEYKDIETLIEILSHKDEISKYLDKDIYYVEETKHGKQLNIQRYYYDEEDLECVEYTGVRIPINGKLTREQITNETESCKQYTYACNEEYILEDMQDITELPITEVDENTPIGKYIDKY